MKGILELISEGTILLSDGAMGTELQKKLSTGYCAEELNVSKPEIIKAIHKSYFDAGSDIVETNSFGSNRSRLKMHGYSHCVKEFSIAAARNAKAVCPVGKFVAGSIGPIGEILEPLGELTLDEACDIFAEQAEALAEGGVDILFVETMMAIEEAEIAVKAAKERTNLPVSATMTFESGNAGLRTMWGVDVPTAVSRLTEAGADIIGANCGRGFEDMIAIITQMRIITSKPLLAQANAGMPELVNGKNVYKETPEIIAPKVESLIKTGANIIGGCCGTGPEHIRKMREILEKVGGQRTEI